MSEDVLDKAVTTLFNL